MRSASGFEKIVKQMVGEIENDLSPKGYNPPGILYHYTDSVGLEGILGNQEIWATHYNCLNDTSELRSGESLVQQVLTVLPEQLTDNLARPLAKTIRDWYLEKPLVSIVEVFVASFSLDGNDLSQWRAYGANGHGYSIGFSFAPDSNGEIAGGLQFVLRGCLYDETKFQCRIGDIVKRASNAFAHYYRTYMPEDEKSRDLIVTEAAKSVMPFIAYEVMSFKNAHFFSEREWRLCLLLEPELMSTCQFRTTPNGKVPYLIVPLKPDDPTFQIKKIFVGPCGESARRAENAETLLTKKRFENCGVVRSTIPYRGCST